MKVSAKVQSTVDMTYLHVQVNMFIHYSDLENFYILVFLTVQHFLNIVHVQTEDPMNSKPEVFLQHFGLVKHF